MSSEQKNCATDIYADDVPSHGLATYTLEHQHDDRKTDGVRIATMHRVKGLELQVMLIAGVSVENVPPMSAVNSIRDPVEASQQELSDRALLHVAATRSIKQLFVTWSGEPSRLLETIATPRLA